jgi:hypothetical protein
MLEGAVVAQGRGELQRRLAVVVAGGVEAHLRGLDAARRFERHVGQLGHPVDHLELRVRDERVDRQEARRRARLVVEVEAEAEHLEHRLLQFEDARVAERRPAEVEHRQVAEEGARRLRAQEVVAPIFGQLLGELEHREHDVLAAVDDRNDERRLALEGPFAVGARQQRGRRAEEVEREREAGVGVADHQRVDRVRARLVGLVHQRAGRGFEGREEKPLQQHLVLVARLLSVVFQLVRRRLFARDASAERDPREEVEVARARRQDRERRALARHRRPVQRVLHRDVETERDRLEAGELDLLGGDAGGLLVELGVRHRRRLDRVRPK